MRTRLLPSLEGQMVCPHAPRDSDTVIVLSGRQCNVATTLKCLTCTKRTTAAEAAAGVCVHPTNLSQKKISGNSQHTGTLQHDPGFEIKGDKCLLTPESHDVLRTTLMTVSNHFHYHLIRHATHEQRSCHERCTYAKIQAVQRPTKNTAPLLVFDTTDVLLKRHRPYWFCKRQPYMPSMLLSSQ